MAKFIYDMSRLIPGDIILARFPNNELGNRIREVTQSDFSHAMLYVGGSSYIEADKRVQARNLARLLFDKKEDTCVVRIKEKYLSEHTIDAAIYYARTVVGNPYAWYDVFRLKDGMTDRFTKETQICTRLVAKAYAYSGLNIVNNVEMCTPQQILKSKCVVECKDLLRVASDFDLRFAESYDVTDDMVRATETLFDSLKSYGDGKIRSMSALKDYVISHPEDDEAITILLQQSGYLNVLEIEEEKNQYNYDVTKFIKFYGTDHAYYAAICALEENLGGKYRYEQQYKGLILEFFSIGGKSHFLITMISLYKQIIEQHDKRIRVCYEVMNSPES